MKRILLTSQNTKQAVAQAATVLEGGGLVIYPTETMYGIGADALKPEAVSKMLKFKNRPAGKSISILVNSPEMAERYVATNDTAKQLYTTFLPGPVTVISQDKGVVDSRLASEFGTLGIRISSHPVAMQLAEVFGGPITSSAANAAGAARPYSIETALAGLSSAQTELIDFILDAGPLPRREPSTVIDTTQEVQEVVRAGELGGQLLGGFETNSEEETIKEAERFVRTLLHVLPEKPLVIALEGPMGAGKTHFAKGVAKALDITTIVNSPTYTLINEYENDSCLMVHFDLWRTSEFDPRALEFDRYLKPHTLSLIEWSVPALPYLQGLGNDIVGYHVTLEPFDETRRRLTFRSL